MTSNVLRLLLCVALATATLAFSPPSIARSTTDISMAHAEQEASLDRRCFVGAMLASTTAALTTGSLPSFAAEEAETLESYLYRVLRVREATQQERRLIKSGKFKDIQRANVKLAVKFMVQNYRLGDAVVGASAYLNGGNQMKAINAGQTAVQNLQTILEYFDTSDVENIKVGANNMAGKEELVLQGLQTAQSNLDQFLTYFPEATVQGIKDKIFTENDLNVKEFDKSLGDIINLPPPS
eukprot:CAMPEP_0113626900 /NCGR_PEP_ID=MMETSP0017_2-20120614/13922_1 /TAXON_ID=2856 /ORGANISM="Cylindrotheca closterium" /LENGTH=238 /DNA_ID=CAMNT_0000537117 /DNA_START=28 /DNA_END=744 /DNA_ORIENTATION=- /assembly_acc=CAM_ASM_000147